MPKQRKTKKSPSQATAGPAANQTRNDGRALEQAIHFLQKSILQNDRGLRPGQYQIELNKTITAGGTRQEVDVYVVLHPGTSQQSVIIFECKDWKETVSKNVVMNLKEKVDILGATRGVLIARAISKGAKALLLRPDYNRIQFRQFDNALKGPFQLTSVSHLSHDQIRATVSVLPRANWQPWPPDIRSATCHWNGRTAPLLTFAQEYLAAIVRRGPRQPTGPYGLPGGHWVPIQERREFAPGEFTLEGQDIATLEIDAAFIVTITEGQSIYTLSVAAEGQVQSFQIEPATEPGERLQLDLVLAAPPASA